MLACCEEDLKEKKISLSRQTSLIDLFKTSSGTRTSPSLFLDTAGDNVDETPMVEKEEPPP